MFQVGNMIKEMNIKDLIMSKFNNKVGYTFRNEDLESIEEIVDILLEYKEEIKNLRSKIRNYRGVIEDYARK